MQGENTKLFEKLQYILKELTFHSKENSCDHSVRELLDQIEFESDESV